MKKIRVDRKNHFRAILTDTLPYEVPLFFTNEPFYLGLTAGSFTFGFPAEIGSLLLRRRGTRPFKYRVRKSGGAHRNLAVPHPSAQVRFAELYRDFDSFIENVCSRSSYSLRYPSRVGSHFFQSQYAANTPTVTTSVDSDPASFSTQRQWASSYFSYRRYSPIHKFFSSREFFRLEQKFSLMLKLDVSRCFESIYTHSIVWAVRGKEFGKSNRERTFFEAEFDLRMQDANWGETNGILIGPEVSRIFAETILQSIDVELEARLGALRERVTIARYVDDFFVFGNLESDLAHVKQALEDIASGYNLHFNAAKTELSKRPFVSSFTVARQRIQSLLVDVLRTAQDNIANEDPKESFSRKASDRTLKEVRRFARQHDVDYALLASPALGVMSRGINRLRQRVGKIESPKARRRVEQINQALLDIATFFYLMDIRAATSHTLAKILLDLSELNAACGTGRQAFEGMVQDSVRLALEQARLYKVTGPEIINVLVAADAVCRIQKGVTEASLRSALGVDADWNSKVPDFNYFDLVSALYFARRKYAFNESREAVAAEIEKRILKRGSKLGDYAEETMLFFDFVSCPYLLHSRRQKLFSEVAKTLGSGASAPSLQMQFNQVSKLVRFIAWDGAKHFPAMLARKELQAAYDS